MRKISLAFVSFLLSATGTLFAQHAKKYADLTLDEYNSEYAEMKKSDDFSTDASGNITKFKKTLPNLCTIVWKGEKFGRFGLDVTITSYDGDVYKGEVYASIHDVNHWIKSIYSNFKEEDGKDEGPIKKDVPLEDMWFIGAAGSGVPRGVITFADKTKFPILRGRKDRIVRVPLKQAGDYYEKKQELGFSDGKVIWKDYTGLEAINDYPYRVTLEDGIFISGSRGWGDQTIIYNNGDVYKGAIKFSENSCLGWVSEHTGAFDRANLLKAYKISDIGRPWYGELSKADGTVVVIEEGEEDEFETIKKTKIAQAKIKEEKAVAKQQAALNQKYGKKYVDAMLKGQVIIGMPEELIWLGIAVGAFLPHFNIMTTSINNGNGNVCKDLTLSSTSGLKNVGYIWFKGGKVSSIVYY